MTNKIRTASLCLICTISLFTFDVSLAEEWLLSSEVYEIASDIKNRGLTWLKEEKNAAYGWDAGDTPRAILAIASAEEDWPMKSDLPARLTAKQLEIELLEKLIRHDVEPVTPSNIALYALALNAVCKDPRNFYGHNLIVSLEKHHKDQDYPGYPEAFGFSLTALVSCLSGSHSHKRQIHHLLLIANDDTSTDSIDTRSISIMALECFRRKRHNEALTKPMGEAVKNLALLQQPEGSFGNNIFTTAIAIQALSVVNDVTEMSWNHTAAVLALSKIQLEDGSFLNSIHATAEAVISITTLLNGVGLLQLRRGKCVDFPERQFEKSTESYASLNTFFTQSLSSNNLMSSPVVDASSASSSSPPPPSSQTIKEVSTDSSTPIMSPRSHKDFKNEKTDVIVTSPQSQLATMTTTTTTPSPVSLDKLPTSSLSSSSSEIETKESSSAIYESTEITESMANIRYWLWIGSVPGAVETEKVNITVKVPVNSTFFTVMTRAASLHPQYEFSAALWPNGHYIQALSKRQEQPTGYLYWLLYLLPTDPDPMNSPPTTFVSPIGVDNLRVSDGDVYLFWYRKL